MYEKLYFNGYNSFLSNEEYVIDDFQYVNVFIGKNNSGKSSLLKIIGSSLSSNINLEAKELGVSFILTQELLSSIVASARIPISNFTNYKDLRCKVEISPTKHYKIQAFSQSDGSIVNRSNIMTNRYIQNNLPKANKQMQLVAAERNIIPESESFTEDLLANGQGATNLIRKIITYSEYNEQLIEHDLLSALNQIMGNDAHYESIRIQELPADPATNNKPLWEIYLQESHIGRVALSQSGSGLKTVILVLLNLLVLPKLYPQKEFIFGFEELENNLHPALQRRLFSFIYDYAIQNKIYIFLTTHSHVAINLFYDKDGTTVYHVTKENQVSKIKKIDNYIDKVEILDDLDVKASDLLQANGIIWVEGPSDRIYIKRWLEVFGGPDVQEGVDFQFAYYGGKNLSHYSADGIEGLISILLTNRNAAIVMDSDKSYQSEKIRDTKKRVKKEFEDKGLFTWITKGREIENYILSAAIEKTFGLTSIGQCKIYEKFADYIKNYYSNFSSKKVPFANKVKDNIDNSTILDLQEKVIELYNTIKSWNK